MCHSFMVPGAKGSAEDADELKRKLPPPRGETAAMGSEWPAWKSSGGVGGGDGSSGSIGGFPAQPGRIRIKAASRAMEAADAAVGIFFVFLTDIY